MASSFSKIHIREIYRFYYEKLYLKRKDDNIMWIGIALVLIGVFLIGQSSK